VAGGFVFPVLLREGVEQDRCRVKALEEGEEELREEEPAIFCRACSHTITTGDQRIEVAGSHRHTFFNPAGIVYELGCFARAPGCSLAGEACAEFSWFAGYLWRIALCGQCGIHLGWRFQSVETSFYGLILSHLQSGGR
jgi:hypothetical protein